jgi:hypothetical protein
MRRLFAALVALSLVGAAVWMSQHPETGVDRTASAMADPASRAGTSSDSQPGGEWERSGNPFAGKGSTQVVDGAPSAPTSIALSEAPSGGRPAESRVIDLATPHVGLDSASDRASSAEAVDESRTSEPVTPESDKQACQAVAKTLEESQLLYDVTPTFVVIYGRGSEPVVNPRSGFVALRDALLDSLCSGTAAYDPSYRAEFEFVAVSATEYTRIIAGNHWVSDGTILSPLPDAAYELLTAGFVQGRRLGAGPNPTRETFDRWMKSFARTRRDTTPRL